MKSNINLPFSEACERNKEPILAVLKEYMKSGRVLEMGHGTGQHAVFFSKNLPVEWVPADRLEMNEIMRNRHDQEGGENLKAPHELEVGLIPMREQIKDHFDFVFTANTLHIMSEEAAFCFCKEVPELLLPQGYLFIYGPFRYEGKFTSESNEAFDRHIRMDNPQKGIREFTELSRILEDHSMDFCKRFDLPANNQLLLFRKRG